MGGKMKIRALIGGYLGWMFDALDYMVLSLALPFMIVEWHLQLSTAGLASTFTVFGAALGAYLWGPISDKKGRKITLAWCLFAFGLFTVLCAFAQNFTQLVACRFVAGVCLGGEWVVGATLVAEHFDGKWRAKATSIIQSAWPIGYFIALGASYWLVPIWGWRVLFVIGGLAWAGALYIGLFVEDSPTFKAELQRKQLLAKEGTAAAKATEASGTGLVYLFKKENRKSTILTTLLCCLVLVAYWGSGSWIPAYLAGEKGLSVTKAIMYLVIYNCGGLLGYVFYGWIADRFGRRMSFWIGGYGSALTILGFMTASSTTAGYIWGGIFGFMCLGYWGPLGAFVSEQFPTHVRGLGVSFCYGTGKLVAALAPFALGVLAQLTSLKIALMWIAVIYALGAVVVHFMTETAGIDFDAPAGIDFDAPAGIEIESI